MSRTSVTRKLRERRQRAEFYRALRDASPAMQNELMAAAAHQNSDFIR